MNFSDLILMAFSNLWRAGLRAWLTIFAVVIGGTLIALMISLGTGANDFILSQFRSFMPVNSLIVSTSPEFGKSGFQGPSLGGEPREVKDGDSVLGFGHIGGQKSFTSKDIETIRSILHVQQVDPTYILSATSIRLNTSPTRYEVNLQCLPDYELDIRRLTAGTRFAKDDVRKAIISKQYCSVFGFDTAEEAIGKKVIIEVSQLNLFGILSGAIPAKPREIEFEIVGVTERTMASTEVIITKNDAIEIGRFIFNNPELYSEIWGSTLQVKVDNKANISKVANDIQDLGFGTQTPESIAASIQSFFRVVQVILSLFGAIALLVASFGIANTLIMSVYERTREIGIMKAVGATNSTIRWLFLLEAALIGFIGGALGVVAGWVLGRLANVIAHMTILKEYEAFNISIFPWWLIPLVLIISSIVAIIAGIIPANRGAKLNPIDALRYE